ncbi:MAG: nuclear transport factor 2 family protein [Myxococcales bacterium]|nr:nuclear transport factor 2 family protein [Myxococcales bacterium]
MTALRITTTTLIAFTLLGGFTAGCDENDGHGHDPAVAARVEAVEADLTALRNRLDGADVMEATLRARIATLEADAATRWDHTRMLEAREDMQSTLMRLAAAIDSGDPAYLNDLLPALADDFVMVAIDFGEGGQRDTLVFEGVSKVLSEFGPIMREAQANLLPSAILVDFIDETHATAAFKFANSVRPPSALNEDVHEKVLLFAAITADFRLEDGIWKLTHLELDHSLAYPGALPPAP